MRRKRNARRRQRYAEDPQARERHRERNRLAYRQRRSLKVQYAITTDPARYAAAGVVRQVTSPSCPGARLTFTVRELGRALGLPYVQLLHRWRRQGQLPGPVVTVARGRQRVYLEPEVHGIAGVLAAHFARVAYYRRDHAETRERLFAAVGAAREALGLPAPAREA